VLGAAPADQRSDFRVLRPGGRSSRGRGRSRSRHRDVSKSRIAQCGSQQPVEVVMDPFNFLWLIPVLPLVGAAINGTLGKRLPKSVIATIGAGTLAISFLISL